MPSSEYHKPVNDVPNSFVQTFNPEKTTERNNSLFQFIEEWKTEQQRIENWSRFWEEQNENTNKR